MAIVLVMCVSTFSDKSIVSSVVSFFTTGLQQVSAAVSKEAGKPSYDELLAENNRLNEQLNELRTELVDYYEVKEENSRLWKYYDLKQTYPSYELMPASVIRRDPSDNFYSFTVNKGTYLRQSLLSSRFQQGYLGQGLCRRPCAHRQGPYRLGFCR